MTTTLIITAMVLFGLLLFAALINFVFSDLTAWNREDIG